MQQQVEQMPRQASIENQSELQNLIFNHNAMDQLYRLAGTMADSKALVPNHLKGNVADCFAVCMQAAQWKMNPFPVAQKTHVVNGTLGYEAQLVNAVINSMAPTKDRLHFEWFGPWEKVIGRFSIKKNPEGKEYRMPAWSMSDEEGLGVNVWATLKGEHSPRTLTLLLAQARTRNSTLWADDPRQQLAYLGIKRWARLYCPDVILGVYTPDELDDYNSSEKDVTPSYDDRQVNESAALPFMPAEKFDSKLPVWLEQISSGQRTADDVIVTLTSRYSLTEQQSQALKEAEVTEQ